MKSLGGVHGLEETILEYVISVRLVPNTVDEKGTELLSAGTQIKYWRKLLHLIIQNE